MSSNVKDIPVKCATCGVEFLTSRDSIRHSKKHHDGNIVMYCKKMLCRTEEEPA